MSKHRADYGTRQVKVTDPDTHELLGYVDIHPDGSAVTASWRALISEVRKGTVALGGVDAPKSSQTGAQSRTEASP